MKKRFVRKGKKRMYRKKGFKKGNYLPRRITSGIAPQASYYNNERYEKIEMEIPLTVVNWGVQAPAACYATFDDFINADAGARYCLFSRTRFTQCRQAYSTYEVLGMKVTVQQASVYTGIASVLNGPIIGITMGPFDGNFPTQTAIANMMVSKTGSANGDATVAYFSKNKYMVNNGTARTSSVNDTFEMTRAVRAHVLIPTLGGLLQNGNVLGSVNVIWYVRFTGLRQSSGLRLREYYKENLQNHPFDLFYGTPEAFKYTGDMTDTQLYYRYIRKVLSEGMLKGFRDIQILGDSEKGGMAGYSDQKMKF